jgi:hypothetical protein
MSDKLQFVESEKLKEPLKSKSNARWGGSPTVKEGSLTELLVPLVL